MLVLDDNDNAPSFPMDRYSFTVAEGQWAVNISHTVVNLLLHRCSYK